MAVWNSFTLAVEVRCSIVNSNFLQLEFIYHIDESQNSGSELINMNQFQRLRSLRTNSGCEDHFERAGELVVDDLRS